jgi:hypothetical protein
VIYVFYSFLGVKGNDLYINPSFSLVLFLTFMKISSAFPIIGA